jgi:undecaprenyl diphosphate synthase
VSRSKSNSKLHVASSHPLGTLTAEEAYIWEKLELKRLPKHLAVIMDGNGRWAKRRHLPRIAGHRKGAEAARSTIETCARLGIEALTLYAFSVENWRRPKTEVDFLMQLLREYIRREMPLLQRNGIRMKFIGRLNELSEGVQRDAREAMKETAKNKGMLLCVALNYGGRAEILDAVNAAIEERKKAGTDGKITEAQLEKNLYTKGIPDPDLLIRTSGELRVSNFLLWQIAYSEIFVTDTLWPDFTRARLLESLVEFQKRERRYGGIAESGVDEDAQSKAGEI